MGNKQVSGQLVASDDLSSVSAEALDTMIRECVASYVPLGKCLQEMRDGQRYKDLPGYTENSTFADYLRTVQGMSPESAKKIIRASLVSRAIRECEFEGEGVPMVPLLIESERQTRVLADKVVARCGKGFTSTFVYESDPDNPGGKVPRGITEEGKEELARIVQDLADKHAVAIRAEKITAEEEGRKPRLIRPTAKFIYNNIPDDLKSGDVTAMPADSRKIATFIAAVGKACKQFEERGWADPERIATCKEKEKWRAADRKALTRQLETVTQYVESVLEAWN